ncbi:MAG: DUF4112 domain-containing protein [Balneolaceae bacterium]|nr:DUF4112 domain-containing protein [Balneolaceae bacterium]
MPQNKSTSKQKQFAELLDSRFTIPGTNISFGIDPLIGLIPGIGDWIGGVASLYFLVHAVMLGAKATVILRMLLNILLDVVIGAIPLLGEIFDVGWKANLKNARLLENLEQHPEETERQSKIIVWGTGILSVIIVLSLLYVIGLLLMQLIEAML